MSFHQRVAVKTSEQEALKHIGTGTLFPAKDVWALLHWDHIQTPSAVPFDTETIQTNGSTRTLVPVSGQNVRNVISGLQKAGVIVKTAGLSEVNKHFLLELNTTPSGWLLIPSTPLRHADLFASRTGDFEHLAMSVSDAIHVLGIQLAFKGAGFSDDKAFYFDSPPAGKMAGPEGFTVSVDSSTRTLTVTAKKPNRDTKSFAVTRLRRHT